MFKCESLLRKVVLLSLFMAFLFVAGCSGTQLVAPTHPYEYAFFHDGTRDDGSILAQKKKELTDNILIWEAEYYALDGQTSAPTIKTYDNISCYMPASSSKSDASDVEARKKSLRDKIVYKLMELVEDYFRRYSLIQYENSRIEPIVAESSAAITTAVAGIAHPAAAKVLSAISAGIQATNTSTRKNYYGDKAFELILQRMDALRHKQLADVTKCLMDNTTTCPLGLALLKVELYADSGSVANAFADISSDTGAMKDNTTATPAPTASPAPTPAPTNSSVTSTDPTGKKSNTQITTTGITDPKVTVDPKTQVITIVPTGAPSPTPTATPAPTTSSVTSTDPTGKKSSTQITTTGIINPKVTIDPATQVITVVPAGAPTPTPAPKAKSTKPKKAAKTTPAPAASTPSDKGNPSAPVTN